MAAHGALDSWAVLCAGKISRNKLPTSGYGERKMVKPYRVLFDLPPFYVPLFQIGLLCNNTYFYASDAHVTGRAK